MCSKSQNDKEEDVYDTRNHHTNFRNMELYSDSNFHFMTSKGYLFLNSDQVKSILLEGQKEAAKKELGKGIRADELLAGEVISVSWKKGICHMTAELHRDRDFS